MLECHAKALRRGGALGLTAAMLVCYIPHTNAASRMEGGLAGRMRIDGRRAGSAVEVLLGPDGERCANQKDQAGRPLHGVEGLAEEHMR